MNTFAVLFLCIQACLVQDVFGQCLGRRAVGCGCGAGIGDYGLAGAYPGALAGGIGGYGLDSYGGVGEGNVAVAGELPVAGATALAGQVPIMGAVRFGGPVCAGGAVSIAGNCACGGCGCGSRFGY